MRAPLVTRRRAVWALLASIVLVGVASLVWLSYRAVGEWQRSTARLVDQRSEEALTLLTIALNRDMKGVHHTVLASFTESTFDIDRRYELEDVFAQAFARFPYPESFFVWRNRPTGPSSIIFNRVDRTPRWAGRRNVEAAYPVVAIDDAPVTRALIEQIQANAAGGRFAAFDTTIDATRYQVVVHLLYQSTRERPLLGAVGFTVDRDWVAQHYFQEILEQISRIGQVDAGLSLGVSDETNQTVASTHPQAKREGVLHERRFPFSFLDADLIGDSLGSIPPALPWTLSVSAVDNRALAAAARGSTRTLWLTLLSAAVAIMGILLTLRALKAGADLTAMQSEFVASATHELKTPLAVFQLIADTLSKGRYGSEETIRVYGNLLAEQTQLLERLIDNVLAYASLAHVARRYDFQIVAPAELVEGALERFDARLVAAGLDVTVDVAPGLPRIRADRASMLQALDNLIDNAIKYSPPDQPLAICAAARDRRVLLQISDRGPGIPVQEREKVFQKFYRGTTVAIAGSGLGLAIARRVIEDHGGTIAIGDTDPHGTTITISLPAASET